MGIPYAEVIGDPIRHSKSPLIHKFWLEKLGIDGDYRATRVTAEELPKFFAKRREEADWRGCNVTMPHKQNVLPFCDTLDELASDAKAVNAIARRDTLLAGYNTDATGFLEALDQGPKQDVPAKYVATLYTLIGAGGAARAIAAALQGREVTIINRTKEKADQLADELGNGAAYGFSAGLEALDPDEHTHAHYPDVVQNRGENQRYNEVIINASAMGMSGNPPVPIRLDRFPPNTLVVDIVYHPVETPLLTEARQLGLSTIDGLAMLLGQAADAFLLFFGQPAPRQYDAELRELLTR